MSKKKEIVSKGIEDDSTSILSEDIIVEMADTFVIEEIDGGVRVCVAELKEDESTTAPSTIFAEPQVEEKQEAEAVQLEQEEQADEEQPDAEDMPKDKEQPDAEEQDNAKTKWQLMKQAKEAPEKQTAIQTYRMPRPLLNSKLYAIDRDVRALTTAEFNTYLVKQYGDEAISSASIYYAGWSFSNAQEKAFDALLRLNNDISTNKSDMSKPDFLRGNGVLDEDGGIEMAGYKQLQNEMQMGTFIPQYRASINTDLYTFARYYTNKEHISGYDLKDAQKALSSLLGYVVPIFVYLEGRAKPIIIQAPLGYKYIWDTNTNAISFQLHPIFTEGNTDNYIKIPYNSLSKQIEAHGSKLPSGYIALRQDIQRLMGNRIYLYKKTLRQLCNIVNRGRMQKQDYKPAIADVFKALGELKKMGLVVSFTPQNSSNLDEEIKIKLSSNYGSN